MARTNNLTNFLTDVAGAIKEKKGSETNIPAANFDTEIRNLPSQGTYEEKTISITQNGTQTVTPSQGYDAIDELTINTNVQPSLQSKSYSFTQNTTTTITPEQGYDGFSSIGLEINVPSGSGDVKLFDTVEHMEAEENPQIGDLAVVYRNTTTNFTSDSQAQVLTFPSSVILPSAHTTSNSLRLEGTDVSLTGNLTKTMFRLYGYTADMSRVDIRYTSSDGITYTRTDTYDSTIDFGEILSVPQARYWNTDAENFVQIESKAFDGFYKYDIYNCDDLQYITGVKIFSGVGTTVGTDSKIFDWSDIPVNDLSLLGTSDAYLLLIPLTWTTYTFNGNDINKVTSAWIFNNGNKTCSKNNTEAYILSDSSNVISDEGVNVFENGAIQFLHTNDMPTKTLINNSTGYLSETKYGAYNLFDKYMCIGVIQNNTIIFSNEIKGCSYFNVDTFPTDDSTSSYTLWDKVDYSCKLQRYFHAPSQITLSNINEVYPGKIAYGKNGVITGDGSIWDNIPENTIDEKAINTISTTTNLNDIMGTFDYLNERKDVRTKDNYPAGRIMIAAKSNEDMNVICTLAKKEDILTDFRTKIKEYTGTNNNYSFVKMINNKYLCFYYVPLNSSTTTTVSISAVRYNLETEEFDWKQDFTYTSSITLSTNTNAIKAASRYLLFYWGNRSSNNITLGFDIDYENKTISKFYEQSTRYTNIGAGYLLGNYVYILCPESGKIRFDRYNLSNSTMSYKYIYSTNTNKGIFSPFVQNNQYFWFIGETDYLKLYKLSIDGGTITSTTNILDISDISSVGGYTDIIHNNDRYYIFANPNIINKCFMLKVANDDTISQISKTGWTIETKENTYSETLYTSASRYKL